MNFQSDVFLFLKKLNYALEDQNIFLEPHWNIDHLCYRVGSLEKYRLLKTEFQTFAKLLTETEVNGRPISTFKLDKPIHFKNSSIAIVELPAPKEGKKTIEGFEHIEIVCDISFKEIEKRFGHVKTDKSGLAKKINQEFEICLGEVNIKFHHLSLESLINLESNKKAWQALEKSEVLTVLKAFDPLVAGTFPLGMQLDDSDLDILIHLKDKNELIEIAQKNWSQEEEFKITETIVDGLDTLVINFKVDSVPIEIFAQNLEPVRQKAYLHFLVEERLLKEVGKDFISLVQRLRKQGMKTEPAFARALNLPGDPYTALLELQSKPI